MRIGKIKTVATPVIFPRAVEFLLQNLHVAPDGFPVAGKDHRLRGVEGRFLKSLADRRIVGIQSLAHHIHDADHPFKPVFADLHDRLLKKNQKFL